MDSAYDSGTIKLIPAEHDLPQFEQVMEQMKKTTWVMTETESDHLSGAIEVLEDGLMFTSIPYDDGWKIFVDGTEIEPEKIANAFFGIRLTAGEHLIEMDYTPKGFGVGMILTLVCAFGLVFCFYIENKEKLRRNMKSAEI